MVLVLNCKSRLTCLGVSLFVMVLVLNCKRRLNCLGLVCDGISAELQEKIKLPGG